jgi:pimeloyl-ACP methyl ester carboxylesterase
MSVPQIDVPEPNESVWLSMSDGAEILLRRHGNPDGLRIVLSHGNGLAMNGYAPFWTRLLDRYDVVLFDCRNHGVNPFHTVEGQTYDRMVEDLEVIWQAMAERFGAAPTVGGFHSMSGLIAMRHAQTRDPKWAALVFFDCPWQPPPGHPLEAEQNEHMAELIEQTARRRAEAPHWRHVAERMAARPAFDLWPPGSHELMARSTMRENPATGTWEVCAHPPLESRMFMTRGQHWMWTGAEDVSVPIKFIGADPDYPTRESPALVNRGLAEESGLPYEFIPNTRHMLQIEESDLAIAAMERFLRELALIG